MKVIERINQSARMDKWDEFRDFQRKLDVIETRLGFPPLRWYHSMYGETDIYTFVCEREWESLVAMAATYAKGDADPEHQALTAQWFTFGLSHRQELWTPAEAIIYG